jgi:hypothetical protein
MRATGRLSRAAAAAAVTVAMVMTGACGGDDDDAAPAGGDVDVATDAADDGATPAGDDAGGGGGSSGDSYGIFTVDGVQLRYAMSDLEYSPNEAISDVTFEKCDPSFFSAGLFAIGYPVDENGELVLADNGDIAGIVEIQLPKDPADTELMDVEVSFDHDPSGIDTRYRGDDTGQSAWTIDGTTTTGTIVLQNSRGEPTVVDFEIVCADE